MELALQFHRAFDVAVIQLMEEEEQEDKTMQSRLQSIYLEELCLVDHCCWAESPVCDW